MATPASAAAVIGRASIDPDLPPLLYLGDHLGYPSGVAHGVTIYLQNVLPELRRRGIDVQACFLREPHPAAASLASAGIEPVFLSAHPLDPRVIARVERRARMQRCGLVYAAGLKASLVARIVARRLAIPVLIHIHDEIVPPWPLRVLNRIYARSVDAGICVSRATLPVAVSGYRLRPDRLRVVHNGLDLARWTSVDPSARPRVRAELQLPAGAKVLAMVGRLYAVKGNLRMVGMMAQIAAAHPDAVLLLVVDGPDRGACVARARELGIESRVRLLGHRSDVPDLLAACDLVVMPSQREGLGLAAMEALAVGRPVVAYAVGGLPEVVTDGEDGRCVPAADEARFAAAVIELFGDPAMLRRYGEQAARNAQRFSLPQHIEALIGCLHLALSR